MYAYCTRPVCYTNCHTMQSCFGKHTLLCDQNVTSDELLFFHYQLLHANICLARIFQCMMFDYISGCFKGLGIRV